MPKKIVRGADAPRSVVNDPRFSSMHSAPIFKKIKKDSNKIKVDERFQTVLTDDRFRAVPGAIDIYGRKTKTSLKSAAAKELNSFYQIDDGIALKDDDPEENAPETIAKARSKAKDLKEKIDDGVKSEDPESRLNYLNRLARGDVSGSSSEDEDSEDEGNLSEIDSDDSEDDNDFLESSKKNQKGPLDMSSDDEDEEDGEEAHATCRLALMNCDWDSLKAQDLMSVLQSFCPTGKTVDMVTVYPSDFGKEKMANEAIHGPPKIWTGGDDTSDDDYGSDGSEGDRIEDDDEDEGYTGIAAIDEDDAVIKVKQGDKWKSSSNVKTGTLTPTAPSDKKKKATKEKVPKADRKGDFKRLPGTVGIVLQDDLVSRGLSRGDEANGEEAENSDEDETNYFDSDISKDAATTTANIKNKKRPAKGKDKRVTLERERFTGAGKGDEDGEGGFDEVALRAYELSKLKYYFAVAELSSVEAAEALMTQLDGVELGHSSMVFDLRFIPEDTSFAGRDVRDKCSEVGIDYQPPDFVVNALQHTTVQCSWDEGEKDRERKLTNISQWRQLQESELLQYVASSDSDDEENDEDDEEEEDNEDSDIDVNKGRSKSSEASGQKKKSAANLRRLLLGGGSDDDDESVGQDSEDETSFFKGKVNGKSKSSKVISKDEVGDDGGEDKGFNDDFFMDDDEGADEKETSRAQTGKSKKGKVDDDVDKSFTYVPDAKKLNLDKKKDSDHSQDETPFETMQRKLTEKRKARKAAKKLLKNDVSSSAEDPEGSKLPKKSGKGKQEEVERTAATTAELELLLSDDDEGYDMRAIHKQEMEAKNGSKGKRKSRRKKPVDADDAAHQKDSTSASGGDFQLDLQDSRFARLLEGDSSFGIDRTSSEFKETKAMKQIFGEQRSRREKGHTMATEDVAAVKEQKMLTKEATDNTNVNSLVSKLKRKYAEQSKNVVKQARL